MSTEQVSYALGYTAASVHLIRGTLGAGVLLTPYAFSLVGYGVAITSMVFTSILYLHSLHSLLWIESNLCKMLKVPHLSFPNVVERSFDVASEGVQILHPYVKLMLYIYWVLPSANAAYLIIISANCRKLLNNHSKYDTPIPLVMGLLLLLCLPRLRFLVPLSILANICTLLNMVMISVTNIPSQWNGDFAVDLAKVPQFCALFVYSMGMTAMVVPLKNQMQNPTEFGAPGGVLNVSFGILSSLVGSFGLVGYLSKGKSVEDNILLDLPEDGWVTPVVLISYTLSMCIIYILIFYAYEETIWHGFLVARLKDNKYEAVWRCCLRVSINMAAYGIAVTVPDFGVLASILGSVGLLMEICLPSILRLLICQVVPEKRPASWILVCKNVAVIVLSVIIFVMSMKSSISCLAKMYKKR